jgi:hypothetical protein
MSKRTCINCEHNFTSGYDACSTCKIKHPVTGKTVYKNWSKPNPPRPVGLDQTQKGEVR